MHRYRATDYATALFSVITSDYDHPGALPLTEYLHICVFFFNVRGSSLLLVTNETSPSLSVIKMCVEGNQFDLECVRF